jgi:hypothetical protein
MCPVPDGARCGRRSAPHLPHSNHRIHFATTLLDLDDDDRGGIKLLAEIDADADAGGGLRIGGLKIGIKIP